MPSRVGETDAMRRAKREIVLGHGYEAAAAHLNVSSRYVKRLAARGVLPRSKRKGFAKTGSVDRSLVLAAFDAGESTESIARRTGKSATFIREMRKTWKAEASRSAISGAFAGLGG